MRADRRQIVEALLDVYRQGAFPMGDPVTGAVGFYSAPVRGILPIAPGDPLGSFHISRSLRRRINGGWFDIRCDTAFARVIRACAEPRPDEPETWIAPVIVEWFELLHQEGFAHSVEAWRRAPRTGEDHLVGGVYGLALGGAFFGESMFSRPRPRLSDGRRDPLDGTDASKVCLALLVEHLRGRGFTLFDTQFTNPHLERLGCVEISHDAYMRRLREALDRPATWGVFGGA